MKQVAEAGSAELDNNYILNREKGAKAGNPADYAALEQALLIKDSHEAEIHVITMGAESAEEILRPIAALDVDKLFLVTDKLFRGSDTLATATILKKAIDILGPFDLIFMGRRAVDGETGHVGPEVAAMLGVPCITNVMNVTMLADEKIICERLLEDCKIKLSLHLPAVVTMCGGVNQLRPASIAGLKKAKDAKVIRLTNGHLMLPEEKVGLRGSPTMVTSVSKPVSKTREGRFFYDPESGAKAIDDAILLYTAGGLSKKRIIEPVAGSVEKPPGLHGVCVFKKDKESLRAGEELIYNCLKNGCKTVRIVVNDENVYDDMNEAVEISEHIKKISLDTLVFPATVTGRAIAPMIAAINGLGITADCTEIHYMNDGGMIQIRPAFGEELLAEIRTKYAPQLATVRPYVYELPEDGLNNKVQSIEINISPGRIRMISKSEMSSTRLEDAKGIIAGGRACGKDGFAYLSRLSDKLGFALGASRSAVSEGYAPYELQIGQTGRTVRPQLYIAFGISGSVQHLAGMKDSDFIIAVNTDKKACIFDYANICIAADWKETAYALMTRISSRERKETEDDMP
jgi:electron transfer flavoprotein alpha subunit